MTPLELSVSDATIWRVTLGLSIMILVASFTLIYDVYSVGSSGLYYICITIVIDAPSVISKWWLQIVASLTVVIDDAS